MNQPLGISWKPELRNVADLKHWDKNPRKITDANYAKLKDKLTKEGMHQVLTIDTDGTVLSGNRRLDIHTELSIEQVWCMVPERPLTEDEQLKIALESNLHDGRWDYDLLSGFDTPFLLDIGFTELQLGLEAPKDDQPVDTRQVIDCLHCGGKLKLSNRVKTVEKVIASSQ